MKKDNSGLSGHWIIKMLLSFMFKILIWFYIVL